MPVDILRTDGVRGSWSNACAHDASLGEMERSGVCAFSRRPTITGAALPTSYDTALTSVVTECKWAFRTSPDQPEAIRRAMLALVGIANG